MSSSNVSLNKISTGYMLAQTAYSAFKIMVAPKSSTTGPLQPSNGYRPPQWASLPSSKEEFIMIRPNIYYELTGQDAANLPPELKSEAIFFDAILKEDHTSELEMTRHPVQTQTSFNDHAFNLPLKLTIEIGMSDVMDSIVSNQFLGSSTKSINAFEILQGLQNLKIGLTITTRLRRYPDMLIRQIYVPDDYTTYYGLKAVLSLEQIMTGEVIEEKVSVISSVTNYNSVGENSPASVATSGIQKWGSLSGLEDWISNGGSLFDPLKNISDLNPADSITAQTIGDKLNSLSTQSLNLENNLMSIQGQNLTSIMNNVPDIEEIGNKIISNSDQLTSYLQAAAPGLTGISNTIESSVSQSMSLETVAKNLNSNLLSRTIQ